MYTGAPLSHSLRWDEDQLTYPLQPCFLEARQSNTHLDVDVGPKWRSLPVEQGHLPTGLTQATNPDFVPEPPRDEEETSPLSITNFSVLFHSRKGDIPSSTDLNSGFHSQYYEHSFAVHDNLPSSQILPATSPPKSSSSFLVSEASLDDSTFSDLQRQVFVSRFHSTSTTNLASIPTAQYLHSINPQTMTVNLLVGIISLPPSRTIITRKGNCTVDLVEMIVGDESRAGFGVNVWLPIRQHPAAHPANKLSLQLEEQMEGLRPRDVVLMRNVALTSFRGKVYGQSLRRGMTGVELVWRSVGDERDRRGLLEGWEIEKGGDGAIEKVKRVREWVLQFVGVGTNGGRETRSDGGSRVRKNRRELPDDTQ